MRSVSGTGCQPLSAPRICQDKSKKHGDISVLPHLAYLCKRSMNVLTHDTERLTYCKVDNRARRFPSFPFDHLLTSGSRKSAIL
jgi:hypothetical protein